MKRSTYKIDYFLTNPDFISWVRDPSSSRDTFWSTWLLKHPEAKVAFYDAIAVLRETQFKNLQISTIRQEEILGNILTNEVSSQYRNHKNEIGRPKLYSWAWGSAAAILLILGSSFLFKETFRPPTQISAVQMVSKQVGAGETVEVYLPDSTLVILNSGSSIIYPTVFGEEFREVSMIGEAYFDVRNDANRRFLVRSGNIVTEVLGTSFNVNAYPGEEHMEVSLEKGAVRIYSQMEILKGISYAIVPGEKLTVTEDFGKSIKSVYDHDSDFGWKEGILTFKDSNLEDFISRIERWYGVQVSVEGVSDGNWAVTGKFKQETLENVLKSLEFSRDVIYNIQDKRITLYLN